MSETLDPYTCAACLKEYKIDVIIPDHLWEKISPKPIEGYKGGGLLCGSCIMEALEKIINGPEMFIIVKQ
jgi:hypothetical protein